MIKSILSVIFLIFLIDVSLGGRLVYRIVVYPETYDISSFNTTTYVNSNNLLPTLQIYDNGTLISVGTRSNKMDVQNDDVERVIYKMELIGNITDRMQEFYSTVNRSGFFMQSRYNGNKSNKICDTFFSEDHYNYEVCVLKGEATQVFDEIRSAIKRIFLTSYTSWEYIPTEFFVTTIMLPRYAYYKNVNFTTRSKILREFDPDEIYIKGEYYFTSCWIRNSLYSTSSPFIDAVNKHRIYNDSYKTFRFIAWIPELSLTNTPSVRSSAEPWYNTYISGMSEPEPLPHSRPNEFLIISVCLIVILFISLCVVFIIRRLKMRRENQTDNSNLYDNLSDSEVLSTDMDQIPQSNQTSYPIFVTTNPMQPNLMPTNSGMQVNPQPYPIFVTTNPMQSNLMPTNPGMTNSFIFPQPTLFYPQTTNHY